MIPTARGAPVPGRVAGLLRSAIVPAFLASGLLHALALTWGAGSGAAAVSAGSGSESLQVRLAERRPAPEFPRVRPAPAAVPRESRAPPALPDTVAETRQLAIPAAGGAVLPPRIAPPVAAPVAEMPRQAPGPALELVAATQGIDQVASAARLADYQALVRATAERLQRYPERARRLGFEGTAVVAIEAQADDALPRVVLVRSSGIGMLDRAAVDLLRRAVGEVDSALAPDHPGQLRFPVRYALRDGRD